MSPAKPLLLTFLLALLAMCEPAGAQKTSPVQTGDFRVSGPSKRHWRIPGDSLETRRWLFSFNPLGALEGPMAVGLGVGYRINQRFELWTESSILTNGYYTGVGPIHGLRQTMQLKSFPFTQKAFFWALDLRYKSYSFNDTADFFNPHTKDTVSGRPYHEHHYFWGVGVQAGFSQSLTRNGRLQIEYTLGIGIKNKTIDWQGISNEYEKANYSIDLNAADFMNKRGVMVYFPGSIRLVWTFGKKM